MKSYDVIILGGGAAGLMCAIISAQRGRRTLVLEGSNKIGKKILMSGGGRCNFTNIHCEATHFLSQNPHFCISALQRYSQWDFIELVEKHGIAYHEKALGQLFCDQSSKQIVALLASECQQAGVEILSDAAVSAVEHKEGQIDDFIVNTAHGSFSAGKLVVATGGLSIPKMGASDFGYRLARQFGHQVLPLRAGLVPLTFTGTVHDLCQRLSGVSAKVCVSSVQPSIKSNLSTTPNPDTSKLIENIDATQPHHAKADRTERKISRQNAQREASPSFNESLLFTHRGLSGPAVLQASSYWQEGGQLSINLVPEYDLGQLLVSVKNSNAKSLLRTVLSEPLPRALVKELEQLYWPKQADRPLAEIAKQTLSDIGQSLNNWVLRPSGTEGYRTAEVTLGGVDTQELSSKTMESKRVPGLFFIGEVIDVTGHLGGFNFQWAWSSAHAAGSNV